MSLLKSLVGYWKLDESSGNAADSSGNGFTLTNVGTATYAAGKINNGVSLASASTQSLEIADQSLLSLVADFGISFWANFTTKAATMGLVTIDDFSVGRSLNVHFDQASDRIKGEGFGGGYHVVTANNHGSISTGTWIHVALWFLADTLSISINNGTPDTVSGGGPINVTSKFRIGGFSSAGAGAFTFNGLIDEVGVWRRAFDADDRSRLYNGGLGLSIADFSPPVARQSITLNRGTF